MNDKYIFSGNFGNMRMNGDLLFLLNKEIEISN